MTAQTPNSCLPVAIVGIGCRFPGANNPAEFWRLLRDGVDAITDVPKDRFDLDAIYSSKAGVPGKVACRKGGFIGDVAGFDASFFGISPREAALMDPQQRLMLEVAWEALEDGGQVMDRLAGSRTGVYLGVCVSDYEDLMYQEPASLNIYSAVGGFRCAIPGRISYVLGLQGPSISLDAGCASSLVAVHLAFQSLQSGECDMALAGGVNLILIPHISIAFSQAGMLSPDGRCKAFDETADGLVRGEGAAIVVLKPLSKALADGDPVYATILGTAVNDDGRGNGLFFSPSVDGHLAVLRDAYRAAGVAPATVQYVECHGTGTKTGDPTEAQALGAFFSAGRPPDRPLAIGSVKSNVGHTETAAGVAGLIKAALSLMNRQLPPSLHVRRPNPEIPWEELRLRVQRELAPWPLNPGETARAGVSSLGISGTNAHVVLEQAPKALHRRNGAPDHAGESQLLVLSARSPEALRQMARAHQEFLTRQADADGSLYDLCYTAAARRTRHAYRLASVASGLRQHADRLAAFLQGEEHASLLTGEETPQNRKIAFVFSGHGAQWVGMGRRLFEREPVFKAAIEDCDRAISEHAGWSLVKQITADGGSGCLDRTDIIQPMLFAIQVALAGMWRSLGIEPDAVVGHSMGEIAAAHVAGALTLDEAARIICLRSRLLDQLRGNGAMALVELSLERARAVLTGYEDRVSVAVSNSPRATVLSGDPAALNEIIGNLERADVYCRVIKADGAGHSPQVDPLCAPLLADLDGLLPKPSRIPMYSSVTGAITDTQTLNGEYWAANMREPVLFSVAAQRMREDGISLFLEVAAHPVLQTSIKQVFRDGDSECTVIASMRRSENERDVLLEALGRLYTLGKAVDWSGLFRAPGCCVTLPPYPWQKERFWIENAAMPSFRHASRRSSRSAHPLLGAHSLSPIYRGAYLWETELTASQFADSADHLIQNRFVLPATTYLDMAAGAALEVFAGARCVLENVEFKNALFLSEERARKVQLAVLPLAPGAFSFRFNSEQEGSEDDREWELNAEGRILVSRESTEARLPAESERPATVVETGGYESIANPGDPEQPTIKWTHQAWRRAGEAIAQLDLLELTVAQGDRHRINPNLWDACMRVAMVALAEDSSTCSFMPVGVRRMSATGDLDGAAWARAVFKPDGVGSPDSKECDVFVSNGEGQTVACLEGVRWKRVRIAAERGARETIDDWLYEVPWEPSELPREAKGVERGGNWLVFADEKGVAKELAGLLRSSGHEAVMVSRGLSFETDGPLDYRINPSSPQELRELLKHAFGRTACRGIAHLWSLDALLPEGAAIDSLDRAHELSCGSVLHLVQALADANWNEPARLWLVTRCAQPVDGEPVAVAQAPLWGLGRVIAREHPELRCKRIDLGPAESAETIQRLFDELRVDDDENEVALRGAARYVPRLAPSPLRRAQEQSCSKRRVQLDGSQRVSFCVRPGSLPENLILREAERREPGPGEVEIDVYATGLNFKDVAIATGLIPLSPGSEPQIGFECAGKVSAVGRGVEGVSVGDEVVAVASPSFASFVVADARLVVPKPARLTFQQGAALPVAFLTACYAVQELGRLRGGETILIHAASGGVGLAAVQLARQVGAQVLATAGTEEKRDYLRSLGIQHVMDSRSFDFADEVLRLTHGQGVDVALNSLAGEFIPKTLSVLKPMGRFLEIGQADVLRNSPLDMALLSGNKAFFAVDLQTLAQKDPDECGRMLREIMNRIERGSLRPLPARMFRVCDAAGAFRLMAEARHLGKIVLSWRGQEIEVETIDRQASLFRADSTYLITGGLGGLGLAIAGWMVEQGARHLALIQRSGPTSSAQATLEELKKRGADVRVIRADVADREQVAEMLGEVRQSMPALRGVVHAAASFDGGVLLQLDYGRLKSAMAAKVSGAWNLHCLTLDSQLDFFLLFSSAASLLGTPGEAGYVAANAFLDGLAHFRRSNRLPCLSINWGAWSDAGRALVDPERKELLSSRGMDGITSREGTEALGEMMRQQRTQVAIMRFNPERWRRSSGSASKEPLLSRLIGEQEKGETKQAGSFRSALLANPGQCSTMLESFVRDQLSQVLKTSPSRIDPSINFNRHGLDSLMSIELRNRLESSLGLSLSATIAWKYPTVSALVSHLAERMKLPLNVEPAEGNNPDVVLAQLKHLSESSIGAVLAAKLRALDEV